jgi:pyruvate,water dikinase
MREILALLRERYRDKGLPAGHFSMLTYPELHRGPASLDHQALQQRSEQLARFAAARPPDVLIDREPRYVEVDPTEDLVLMGTGVFPGIVRGRAAVCTDPSRPLDNAEILVFRGTEAAWAPFFAFARGLVFDVGGPVGHAAVIARDLALPAVVDVGVATRLIRTGDLIEIDGTAGTVRRL